MRLTLLSTILAAASYATLSSAQDLASVLSLLPAGFAGAEELLSLLPLQCMNGTHFVTLETGYAMATAQQTWALIGNFGNYTWAGLNVTQSKPALFNATGTGATRSYSLGGTNVTDTLLFKGGLDGKAYAAAFETAGSMMNSSMMNSTMMNSTMMNSPMMPGSFSVNGTSFDKVVSGVVVLNNSLSVGSHIVWIGVGCTSGNASAARSTYSRLTVAALRDIVRAFAS